MIRRVMPLLIVLLLFAGASTACGSAKSGGKGGTGVSPSPAAKVPTADELKKGLLALSDLPAGYSASPEETPSGGDTSEPNDSSSVTATSRECNQLFNEFGNEGNATQEEASVSADFEKSSTTGPFIKETLESYRDAAALQKDMTQVRDAVDKCGEFTVKEQGGDVRVKIANASFPKLGDETAAFKLEATVTAQGKRLTLGGYLVAVRVGNVVSTIISFGLPSADAAETEQIVRKAVDKVTPIAH
jgi:hypothetical protein